jgi:hypothetical protein
MSDGTAARSRIERRLILAAEQLQTVHGSYQLLASGMQIPSRRSKTLVAHKTLNDSEIFSLALPQSRKSMPQDVWSHAMRFYSGFFEIFLNQIPDRPTRDSSVPARYE